MPLNVIWSAALWVWWRIGFKVLRRPFWRLTTKDHPLYQAGCSDGYRAGYDIGYDQALSDLSALKDERKR